ncbi:unnamed protein product [Echinostoma caproni]|uniref:Sod_Cu domain-containing protein n=1 Tax=Echinostoma caproni TaxID=27848 RepID=A0A183BCE4_9TREM|nr:unnamed protein product [Echinostoma caproni]
MRSEEHPTRIHSQQSHPSRRTFTRPRCNPQQEGPPCVSRQPPPINTQSRYAGPNHSGENVAPRSRDDHRLAKRGPQRSSAVPQTSGYRPDPIDIMNPPHQNERVLDATVQSSGHNLTFVTDAFGNPTGLFMDDGLINPKDAQFHPGAVSYSL